VLISPEKNGITVHVFLFSVQQFRCYRHIMHIGCSCFQMIPSLLTLLLDHKAGADHVYYASEIIYTRAPYICLSSKALSSRFLESLM
jgi:hypothetical protein